VARVAGLDFAAGNNVGPEPYRAFIPDASRGGPPASSPTPSPTSTATPTATPTASPTPTPTATATPRPPTPTPTATPAPVYVTVVVTQGENTGTVRAEVADTPARRSRGLMFREYLPPDEGMIFLFPSENDENDCFWMKNTIIPLDIAFIDSAGRVIAVRQGVPESTARICPPGPYRNVLEVNQGWFEAHGLGVGATVQILP
jgi:uncharacterized membrane protein (UPF0127 family)